jgi:hypothetical protein
VLRVRISASITAALIRGFGERTSWFGEIAQHAPRMVDGLIHMRHLLLDIAVGELPAIQWRQPGRRQG